MVEQTLEKEINGHVWRWRLPRENDLQRINALATYVSLFPNDILTEYRKSEIKYLKWINCWD